MKADFPILEYDPSLPAMIEPRKVVEARQVPAGLVLCFFQDVIEKVAAENHAIIVATRRWEDGPHPIYQIEHRGQQIAFMHPGIGGPISAGLLEAAIATGFTKFIACGGCGVLDQDLHLGHLVTVSAAVRDEGTSYHYLPPSREVSAQLPPLERLEAVLKDKQILFRRGKTWTTDAPYRETPVKIAARKSEGCLVVEMEAASLMAVAQFRNVPLAYLLYGGDDLSGSEWDNRGWQSRADIRQELFWLAVEACLSR